MPATSATRRRCRPSKMHKHNSAARSGACLRPSKLTPTSSPTRTSSRCRHSWRGPRTQSSSPARTVLLLLAAPAAAQTFPALTGRVVDEAHLLSAAQVQDLTSKSEALEASTKRQFVVATVPSLEGRTVEDYGYRLGRAWGIGQKGKDDGVILLVAPNEHKVRIETGYAARVFLTDAVSSVIIREAILPHFKQDPPDYGG